MNDLQESRPDFESMSKKDMIKILDEIRESLFYCQDSQDFCLYISKLLNVNTSV